MKPASTDSEESDDELDIELKRYVCQTTSVSVRLQVCLSDYRCVCQTAGMSVRLQVCLSDYIIN